LESQSVGDKHAGEKVVFSFSLFSFCVLDIFLGENKTQNKRMSDGVVGEDIDKTGRGVRKEMKGMMRFVIQSSALVDEEPGDPSLPDK
jgi:hypothetical protein